MIVSFFCKLMIGADKACKAYQQSRDEPEGSKEVKNAAIFAIFLDYDHIAIAASKRNHFDLSLPRNLVANAIKRHIEEELKLEKKDLPLLCPSSDLLEAVYKQSLLLFDKAVFPDRVDDTGLRQCFQKTIDGKKIRNVNVDNLLDMNTMAWKDFLST